MAQIHTDFDSIGEDAWNDLVRRSARATVFQSWSWQRAWWNAFHDATTLPRSLLLISERGDDGALLAVAPLMVEEQGKRRTIKFVGDGQADTLDFLCDDLQSGSRERLLEHLARRADLWDAVALDAIPSDSPTVGAVREWVRRSGLSDDWTTRASSPTIPVPMHQAAIAEEFSIAQTRDPRVIASALDAFLIQHIHRWSSSDLQSQFALRTTREMYRALVIEHAGDAMRLTTVRAYDRVVGYGLSFQTGSQLWCEMSSDVVETKLGVESVLLDAVFALARQRGATSLMLARGDELLKGNPAIKARRSASVRVTRGARAGARKRLASTKLGSRLFALGTELRQVARVAANAQSIVDNRMKRSEFGASHRDYYDAGSITKVYVRETRLQKPEQVILRELQPKLPSMRVLDVGVGAGRTAPYFGTTALEYRGFDFAPNMVAACRRLAGDIVNPARIAAGDARAMRDVSDGSCDLVLISYNAIDDIGGEEDRFKVLAEVRRVAAPGAYFCFSSHNIKSLTAGGASTFMERMKRLRRYLLLRAANPGLRRMRKESRAMIHDVGLDYRFPHYYIAPSAQARQLADFGFTNVRVFSVNTGEEIADSTRWDGLVDSWVYYLCRAPSHATSAEMTSLGRHVLPEAVQAFVPAKERGEDRRIRE